MTTVNGMTLIDWLRVQLDADERVALAAAEASADEWQPDGETLRSADGMCLIHDDGEQDAEMVAHIAVWDPARVLAEVKAKRAILDDCAYYIEADDSAVTDGLAGRALTLLAQPYAGRDGWQDEWSVSE